MTTERNLEVLKEAGAIVHSDGNIFFTNQSKLDAYTTRICADKDALILEVRKLSEQALESSQKSFDAANAIIAEQAEAIKKLRAAVKIAKRQLNWAALTATPESVQAWRRELEASIFNETLEKLRAKLVDEQCTSSHVFNAIDGLQLLYNRRAPNEML